MARAWILTTLALLVGCPTGDTDETGATTPEPDPSVTDTFPQTLITPVDVVWVVDAGWNEGVVALDDTLVDDAMHLYLLADPSWRLGVLDAAAGGTEFGLIKSVLETWPRTNPMRAIGTDGRLEPRYREALYTALDLRVAEGDNEDFLRSDAHLYVVYMGSRPDASSDKTLTEDAFVSWLAELRPSDSKRLSVYTDSNDTDYWDGLTFGDGKLFSVGSFRDQLMALFLDSMGQRVTFTLTQPAVEAPLVATVIYREQRTDYAIDRDFSYDPVSNSITFTNVIPPPESTVEVKYIPVGGTAPATPTETAPTTTASGTL